MKKLIMSVLLLGSSMVYANTCYNGAYSFTQTLNNLHYTGYSKHSAEKKMREVYGAQNTNLLDAGNRYLSILYTAKRGEWSKTDYDNFSRRFATGACK